MKRQDILNAVAGGLGLPPEHDDVKALMAYGYLTLQGWRQWPWYGSVAASIEREEGGKWGVAWLVISRAVALLSTKRAMDPKHATILAQREVLKELRAEHDGTLRADTSYSPLPWSDMLATPWTEMSVNGNAEAQVARLYALASPEERALLDLYDQGYSGVEAAVELGVTSAAVYKRAQRLRAKADA